MASSLYSDSVEDVATSSNFRDISINHYHFFLDISFDKKEIDGIVKLTCGALKKSDAVLLDIYESLEVYEVRSVEGSCILGFTTEPFTDYGSTLRIKLHETKQANASFSLVVKYIARQGPGLVWLDPIQTAGKVMPFMYTQGQSVLNRGFFPCQDTPAVKFTYSANVKLPDGFTAVMSANKKLPKEESGGWYYYEQTTAIPAYLVAMAVGDIKGATIGPRSTVYAESCVLEKARAEFEGVVEEFLQTGERLFGEYVWEQYDILVMPPSFPFGGMENPCLTFVTPCLLVGDKSLTNVVIHEICHSWFGNLVTSANWSEFWLNEGFTMFAQRRIMDELYGTEYMCLDASIGLNLLNELYCHAGEDHPLNCLRVKIASGVHPDDTYNETPYEKGFCFVSYLQQLAGGKTQFDDFLKAYVKRFKYKSIVADDMLDFFLDYFPHLKDAKVNEKPGLEFEQWLTRAGRPPFLPDLSASHVLTDPADRLAELFSQKDIETPVTDISEWKTFQVLYFLDRLVDKSPLTESGITKFIESYPHIPESDNSEIILRWSKIVIRNNLVSHFAKIRNFLSIQGKIKYTVPIYQELMKGSEECKSLAKEVYSTTKEQLHEEVTRRVERIMPQQ